MILFIGNLFKKEINEVSTDQIWVNERTETKIIIVKVSFLGITFRSYKASPASTKEHFLTKYKFFKKFKRKQQ